MTACRSRLWRRLRSAPVPVWSAGSPAECARVSARSGGFRSTGGAPEQTGREGAGHEAGADRQHKLEHHLKPTVAPHLIGRLPLEPFDRVGQVGEDAAEGDHLTAEAADALGHEFEHAGTGWLDFVRIWPAPASGAAFATGLSAAPARRDLPGSPADRLICRVGSSDCRALAVLPAASGRRSGHGAGRQSGRGQERC